MQPFPDTTDAVTREWSASLRVAGDTVSVTRINGRSVLTMLGWSGCVEAATQVIAILVDNAITHACRGRCEAPVRLPLRLALTDSGVLLIDLGDPLPGFERTDAGEREDSGLARADSLGATVSWALRSNGTGKTVRAAMRGNR